MRLTMRGRQKDSLKALVAAGVVVLSMAATRANAALVTFDWVPITEQPTSGPPYSGPSTASGSLTLDLSTWALTGSENPPNFGPYYSSGTAMLATITAFSFTSGEGVTVGLSNLSTTTIGVPDTGPPYTTGSPTAQIWATSGIDTPATGAQAPSAPTAGYYLITPFSVSGTATDGATFNFMVANNSGTAGATYPNGIPNADATFQPDGSIVGIEDGGYWELAPTPVPLPAGLPLLLAGLGLVGWFARRGVALPVAA